MYVAAGLVPSVTVSALALRTIAASSSISVTGRFLDTGSYSSAVWPSGVVCVMFDVPPAAVSSSSAMTVTACAVFQFDVEKLRTSRICCPVPPALRNT